MRKIFCIIMALWFSVCAFGQINMSDSTVQAITYWNKGDIKKYYIIEEKKLISNNDTIKNLYKTYVTTIKVVKAAKKYYIVEWHLKNFINIDLSKHTGTYDTITQQKIIIKISDTGEYLGIQNWKQLQKEINKNPEQKEILGLYKQFVSTKQAIEIKFTEDIQLFHYFYGYQYKLGDTITSPIEIDIIPQKPINANLTLYLDSINNEQKYYILKSETLPNKTDIEKFLHYFLEKLINYDKIEINLDEEKSEMQQALNSFNIKEFIVSSIDDDGWLLNSEHTSIRNILDKIQIKTTRIHLINK